MFGLGSVCEHDPVWNCVAGPAISSVHEWLVNLPAEVAHAWTAYVPAWAAAGTKSASSSAAIPAAVRRSLTLRMVEGSGARSGGCGGLRLGVVPRREDPRAGGGDRDRELEVGGERAVL